jgi:hypothetical protein
VLVFLGLVAMSVAALLLLPPIFRNSENFRTRQLPSPDARVFMSNEGCAAERA